MAKESRQPQGLTPIFLTARQVGDALGVSRSTVQRLMDEEQLPWVSIGSRRRIPAAAFQAWADHQIDAAIARQLYRRGVVRHARFHCN